MLRLLLVGLGVWLGTGVAAADEARPPNVVYILIDDLSDFTMTPYGATAVTSGQGHFAGVPLSMPNVERLAREGVRATQSYVYPICEPSRVAILTGMHNGRNFVAPKALHHSQITVSDVFKRAGYATGMFGKWKQTRGTAQLPAATYPDHFGWDDWLCFDVTTQGRRYLDPHLVENGVERVYGPDDLDPATGRRWYGPDICNRALLDFVDEHRDRPFFVYYPMILVHDEHTPTPDTVPASAYDDYDAGAAFEGAALKGDDRRYFPDMLAYMDKLIGRVLDKLDEHGLTENTLVVLQGDNGTKVVFSADQAQGLPIAGAKGQHRFTGERVGLIFRQPGTVPDEGVGGYPRTFDGLVDAVDLYPTLLDAAGIDVPNAERIDGVSVWPNVTGASDTPAREALYKWYNGNRAITGDQAKTVRFAQTASFKRYAPHGMFTEGRFFDLRTDPWERAGGFGVKAGWMNDYFHGLDVSRLDGEQRAAYEMLGRVLHANDYVAVESIAIAGGTDGAVGPLAVGDAVALRYVLTPEHATRNNAVWVSDDEAVATVDKFGTLTAVGPGETAVHVYSWDDAEPVADGWKAALDRSGMTDAVRVRVE